MRVLAAVFISGYLCASVVVAQGGKKPENVQVLTGLSLRELRSEMMMMSDALDVKCAFCHVQGNFASDENRNKVAARDMLRMTKSINQQFFANASTEGTTLGRVTCFTCHRGSRRPVHSLAELSTLTQ